MKNRVLLVLLAMVLVVSLVAFAACKAEEEAPPVVEEVWQWPDKLVVAGTSTGSATYAMSVAWTTPLAEDTGIMVRVIAEESRTLRMKWLKEGIFFCSTESQGGKALMEANEEYATRDGGPIELRQFYPVGTYEQSYVTRGDSDIKTPRDIKPGTRIVDLVFMPAYNEDALLAWAQVDPEDIVWVPAANTAAMAKLIMDGKADLVFSSHSASSRWYEAEAAPHGINFIDMNPEEDPEGAARYWAIEPENFLGIMSAGVPSSVGKWGRVNISTYQLTVKQDAELVYHVAKWLYENWDKYKGAHSWGKDMTIENLLIIAETNFSPLHDGSVRLLLELGMWTDAHEARQQYNVDRLTQYVTAYQAAIDFADEQGMEVHPVLEAHLEVEAVLLVMKNLQQEVFQVKLSGSQSFPLNR